MIIQTTERAHELIDLSIKFNELMAKTGVNTVGIDHNGKVESMFLNREFFKMAFPSVEPTIDPSHTRYGMVFYEYKVHYNGVKFYAYDIKFEEGEKDDTGKADCYTE